MSRARLKGPTIGVRLPLNLDAAVRVEAERAGLSPGVYLAARIARMYVPEGTSNGVMPRRNESNTRTVPVEPVWGCLHKDRTPIAGGLARCRGCGRVRGADGAWR